MAQVERLEYAADCIMDKMQIAYDSKNMLDFRTLEKRLIGVCRLLEIKKQKIKTV